MQISLNNKIKIIFFSKKNIESKPKKIKPNKKLITASDNPKIDGGPKTKVPKISCKHCYKSIPQQQHKGNFVYNCNNIRDIKKV